jgi:hypothetical protein
VFRGEFECTGYCQRIVKTKREGDWTAERELGDVVRRSQAQNLKKRKATLAMETSSKSSEEDEDESGAPTCAAKLYVSSRSFALSPHFGPSSY